MTLEDQIADALGKEIAQEIDQGLMMDLMIQLGWHEVVVNPWIHHSLKEINKWVKINVQGGHLRSGNRWVLELSKDATIFALKWG